MIVVLAAVIALVGIALVAGLPRLEPAAPSRDDGASRPPADDVYTAWFNANRRCGEALQAWREAAPAARRHAYRTYQVELALEAAAAAELALHATPLAA